VLLLLGLLGIAAAIQLLACPGAYLLRGVAPQDRLGTGKMVTRRSAWFGAAEVL